MPQRSLPRGNELAARILSFLAADDGRLKAFFAYSGISPRALRALIGTSGLRDALVAFILDDDFRMVAFAAYCEVDLAVVAGLQPPLRLVRLEERGQVVPLRNYRRPEIGRRFRSERY